MYAKKENFMKVSNIGLISKKLEQLDQQFPVQDMLIQTGQLMQFTSGIYAFGHIPYLLEKKIYKIVADTMTKYGAGEISLPILQPEQIWQESGRLDRYVNDGVMFRSLTKNGNYCLAPTAEEAVVAFAKARLKTYKQLPVTYFQIGQKFRNEIRSRGFLLRGKSFDMFDAYSFGKDKQDLDVEYDRMKQAYLEIFDTLGLNVFPVGADSGSIGGAKSEEFMMLSDIGEDTVFYDSKTGKAFNKELLDREDHKQYLLENYGIEDVEHLEEKRTVELGHIFQLGDKYSKSMNATYIDSNGKEQNFVMGCYGIGVSRTLATIYENAIVQKDGKFEGISLPVNIAPYTFYLIAKIDDEQKLELATKVYNQMEQAGIKVLFDDRNDISIGAKIKDCKITGTPYLVIFGKSIDEGFVEIESTKTGEKLKVELSVFVEYCKDIAKQVI